MPSNENTTLSIFFDSTIPRNKPIALTLCILPDGEAYGGAAQAGSSQFQDLQTASMLATAAAHDAARAAGIRHIAQFYEAN